MRALDRRLRQPAGLAQAFAKPHDSGKGVDNAKMLARPPFVVADRPGDQETTIVGAEIERGVSRRTARKTRPALGGKTARARRLT